MAEVKEPTGDPKEAAREGQKPSSSASGSASHPDLPTITINAKTGQILRIESVDDTGARHELSDEEKASLEKEAGNATLQDVIEQAFEAGIACMIGDGLGDEDLPESEENVKLRRVLLKPLIEQSAAKRLMQREVLSRAIVGTLISEAVHSRGPHGNGGRSQQRPKGSAGKSRQRTQSAERAEK